MATFGQGDDVRKFRHRSDATKFHREAAERAEKAFARSWAFDFVEFGYVWHFTNVIALRSFVMRETWRRIRHNYPGALLDDKE